MADAGRILTEGGCTILLSESVLVAEDMAGELMLSVSEELYPQSRTAEGMGCLCR